MAGVVKKISNNQIDVTELPIKKWTQEGFQLTGDQSWTNLVLSHNALKIVMTCPIIFRTNEWPFRHDMIGMTTILSFLHGIMSWIFRDVSDIGLQGVSEQDDRGRLHAAWLTQRSWLDAKFHQAEGDSRGRIDDFKEYHTVSCPQPARIQSCYISAQSYTSHLLVSFWSALTSKTWRFVLSFWRTCYNTDSTRHWYIGSIFWVPGRSWHFWNLFFWQSRLEKQIRSTL